MDKLTYGNQFDPAAANGGRIDPNLPNFESFANRATYLPDFNLGLIYYYCKNQSRINPYIGFSSFHI